MGRKLSVNGKFNVFMFLSVMAVFIFLSLVSHVNTRLHLVRDLFSVLMFGVIVAVNYSMPRRQYIHSNAVCVFMSGLILWLLWVAFEYAVRLVQFRDSGALYRVVAVGVFVCTFFLSARIIIAYDLKLPFLRNALLISGAIITLQYILHFDGFRFLSNIRSIFLAGGRYRNDFGFGHVNMAGFTSAYFILLSFLYSSVIDIHGGSRSNFHNSLMYTYIFAVRIIAFLMLLSTASRTNISGLLLYLFIVFLLYMYRKNAVTANALLIIIMVIIAFIAAMAIDWYFILRQSGRLGNYATLLKMSDEELITGFGMVTRNRGNMDILRQQLHFHYMDSMYAITLLRSGLVGIGLFFGSMLISMKLFLSDLKHMTKVHRAVGALCVQGLWYFLFEQTLFDFSWCSVVFWSMFIVVANEKAQTKHAIPRRTPSRFHKIANHPISCAPQTLHNS